MNFVMIEDGFLSVAECDTLFKKYTYEDKLRNYRL